MKDMEVTEQQGPFEGFDPELRLVCVLPEEQRPTHSTTIGLNERGGLLVDTGGHVWWCPRRRH